MDMNRIITAAAAGLLLATLAFGSAESVSPENNDETEGGVPATDTVTIPAGTRVPLVMINSVSSKHSKAGDPVYLESVYPVVQDGRIVIPTGTHVSGTVTHAKRPGRIVVAMLPAIAPGLDREPFMDLLRDRIESETARLYEEAGRSGERTGAR